MELGARAASAVQAVAGRAKAKARSGVAPDLQEEVRRLSKRNAYLEARQRQLKRQLLSDTPEHVTALIADRLRAPSFLAQLAAGRRALIREWQREGSTDPRIGMNRKLAMYRHAESHGVRAPEVYGLWQSPEEIDWESLPDRFVLKADGGAAGNGVFPLVRKEGGLALVGSSEIRPTAFYTEKLQHRLAAGKVRPPYFAEELLEDPRLPGTLPPDVKIYAFYGEVGHVLLRGMTRHADRSTARWRYLDPTGKDLGKVNLGLEHDDTVPVPARLAEMLDIARRLSLSVPMPFIRVDLYDLPNEVLFGELTMFPGGDQQYTADHDQRLGRMWEKAATRLAHDLRAGRPNTLLRGDHPVRTPAPEGY